MQYHPLVSYFIKLSFYSVIISFLALFSLMFIPKEWATSNTPYFILLFYIITGISYSSIYLFVRKKIMKFENIFMISKFIKLLVYIMVIIIYLFINNTNIKAFIVSYAILYILYTVFDTITLSKLAKKLK